MLQSMEETATFADQPRILPPAQNGEPGAKKSAVGATVLVVEDNDSNRKLLELYLARHGYQVVSACDGESALTLCESRQFDLVLLDIMMPGISGFDVLRELRKKHSEAELPVIVATAISDPATIVEALQLGANDYVTKPYDMRVLIARIQTRLKIEEGTRTESSGDATKRPLGPGSLVAERYELEAPIGAGASGVIYSARHIELDNPVAVKVLRLPEDEEKRHNLLQHFRREGISACRVKHPNAVSVLDAGVSKEGIPYLVMERLFGNALDYEIANRAPLSPARCADLLVPVCDVLAEAHAAGVIHRDIKPANIFVHKTKRGETIKVLDFGIALMVGMHQSETQGQVVGTPAYMAPERIRNREHDGRADLYSLGVVLFEMLTGRCPFISPTNNAVEVARMQVKEEPLRVSDFRSDVPTDLADLVAQTLSKRPEERPTLEEFAVRLAASAAASSSTRR